MQGGSLSPYGPKCSSCISYEQKKCLCLQSSASGIMTLVTTAGIVLGTVLPFTAFGAELGFVGLSPSYFLYLIPTIVAYLALVAFIKVLYVKRYGQLL